MEKKVNKFFIQMDLLFYWSSKPFINNFNANYKFLNHNNWSFLLGVTCGMYPMLAPVMTK